MRGQHLPLVDRFTAALAAAKAPAPRAKAPGKLVDVERMFHEVARPLPALCGSELAGMQR